MKDITTLNRLERWEKAVICGICLSAEKVKRLADYGIVEGGKISCIGISPLGDPKAYFVRGTVIALRDEDAERIKVERENDMR